MNSKYLGVIIVAVIIVATSTWLLLIHELVNTAPTSTTPDVATLPSSARTSSNSTGFVSNASTRTPTTQPNNNTIVFYKYNSTYYVFVIPNPQSNCILPGTSWCCVVKGEVITIYCTTVNLAPLAFVLNTQNYTYCFVFGPKSNPWGPQYYKIENGSLEIFAKLNASVPITFIKGQAYVFYIETRVVNSNPFIQRYLYIPFSATYI